MLCIHQCVPAIYHWNRSVRLTAAQVDAMGDDRAFSAMEDREMFKPDLTHAAAVQEDEE